MEIMPSIQIVNKTITPPIDKRPFGCNIFSTFQSKPGKGGNHEDQKGQKGSQGSLQVQADMLIPAFAWKGPMVHTVGPVFNDGVTCQKKMWKNLSAVLTAPSTEKERKRS
jgi:hypothetical protein